MSAPHKTMAELAAEYGLAPNEYQVILDRLGREPNQVKVLHGLGLRGIRRSVVVENTPSFRGMVKKVLHLVTVEETDG